MTSTHSARSLPRSPAAVESVTDRGAAGADTAPLAAALLAALPAAARVLALGEGAEALGEAHAHAHEAARWQALPWGDAGLPAAAASAQVIVVADGFAGAADATGSLRALAATSAPGAALFTAFENRAHLGALVAIVEADLGVGDDRPAACRAFDSPASAAKALMDAGWMPQISAELPSDAIGGTAVAAAAAVLGEALGLPRATVQRSLGLGGFVLQSVRSFEPLPAARPAAAPRFDVVVPTTRPRQLRLNVEASPGLRELGARVVAIEGASSPADALAQALPQVGADWVLLCHQDVYFPAGFGARLNAVLEAIPEAEHAGTLIGFAGMGVDAARQGYTPAGFVIDRLHRFDHAASEAAVSIDELAIVVSRRTLHRIDPAMGWHLWATDLCLAAICEHKVFPRIVRLPLFHNSSNDYTLPEAFHASAARLAAKFAQFGPIPTLCGTIDAAFLARGAAPKAAPAPAPEAKTTACVASVPSAMADATEAAAGRRCCLCGEAVAGWLPHPHRNRRSELMKLLGAVGSDLAVYQCPSCGSNDRERHLWLYMSALQLPQRFGSMRILHIAPEPNLEAIILELAPLAYVRGDLHPRQPEHVALDAEALAFADASFDLVICNHVLEHVAHPDRALAEFHRVLAPGGSLVAQTPYAPSLLHTLELNRPVSPAFATLLYGQADHLRLFGADVADRIRAAGFRGGLAAHDEVLGALDAQLHGVNAHEPFFCFTR